MTEKKHKPASLVCFEHTDATHIPDEASNEDDFHSPHMYQFDLVLHNQHTWVCCHPVKMMGSMMCIRKSAVFLQM